ncbi:MAG: apolipoprotein N-acyltransferase [Alphaproteobacteria bacterium]|nr:apolipoprotein N-acyltransferase [Alphaproteobacteria bacterium]
MRWFVALSRWPRFLLTLLLGVGIGTGQAPWSLVPVSLVALFLAVWAFSAIEKPKQAAWFGWALGTGYFAAFMFWIVEPFLVEPEVYGWMAPFALVFMVAGLALFWALGFGVAAALGRNRRRRLLALIVTLGLAELLRSYVFTGFPWGLLGYIWLDTPIAQLAAFVGPHGLGALALGVVILPMVFSNRLLGGVVELVFVALLWGAGGLLLGQPAEPAQGAKIIRLIQPNASQQQKWEPEFAPIFYARQLGFTAAVSETRPDLVIWPEAAVTFWLGDEPDAQARIVEAAPENAQVIIGARRYAGRRIYNSMVLLGKDGQPTDIYDKTHLVPFGEYVPFGGFLSRFGIYGLAAEDGAGFSSGTDRKLLDLGALGKVVPLICYESIFPNLSRFTDQRPDWILQITNDAWFGQLAGPQQHLAQARMRAIEQGLPFVRAANTGVSAVIDPRGRIVAQIGLGKAGFLDVPLPKAEKVTLYNKTGDFAVLVLLLLGLGSVLIARIRN